MVMCVCVCVDNKMVELYEGAAHVYPNNEEILTQLFMAYVRVGAYQKQQQVQYPPTHYQNYHSHSHSLSLFTHSLYSLSLSLTLSLSLSLYLSLSRQQLSSPNSSLSLYHSQSLPTVPTHCPAGLMSPRVLVLVSRYCYSCSNAN